MSDASDIGGGPDRSDGVLAAEYVLHLLEPAERRLVEERIETSGSLRLMVALWSEDLVRLTDTIAEVTPPPRIRETLARLVASEASARAPARPARSGFSLGRFLGGALGGLALATAIVVLLAVSVPRLEPPYAGPVYTAEIAGDDPQAFLVAARYNPGDNTLVIEREAGEAPPGRVLQLWLLPEGATSPVSLGLLPAAPEASFELSDELGAGIPNGLMEISEEPPGGSPTGGPTGNVLGIGNVGES